MAVNNIKQIIFYTLYLKLHFNMGLSTVSSMCNLFRYPTVLKSFRINATPHLNCSAHLGDFSYITNILTNTCIHYGDNTQQKAMIFSTTEA